MAGTERHRATAVDVRTAEVVAAVPTVGAVDILEAEVVVDTLAEAAEAGTPAEAGAMEAAAADRVRDVATCRSSSKLM